MTNWQVTPTLASGETSTLSGKFNTLARDLDHLYEQAHATLTLTGATNATAGLVLVGDTSADLRAAVSTSVGQAGPIWVAETAAAVGATLQGVCAGQATIACTGAVSRGDHLQTSATAGTAQTGELNWFATALADDVGGMVLVLLQQPPSSLETWPYGASTASTGSLTLPATGTVIPLTGTTTITSIAASYRGRVVALEFASAGCQVTDNNGTLQLDGNYVSTAGGYLLLRSDGTNWYEIARTPTRAGTVTSVALTMPAEFSVAGSPVTSSGTLAVTKATQTANLLYAGPTSGAAAAPAFRAMVAADVAAHSHTVAGTDGGPLTSPRIVTSLADTNGNPLQGITATASAVNYWRNTNAATGNAPQWVADGTDTNINGRLGAKGSNAAAAGGQVQLDSPLLISTSALSQVSARLGSNQTGIAQNTITLVNIDTESHDNLSEFDTTAHTFTAIKAGQYLFDVEITWSSFPTTTTSIAFLYVNGAEVRRIADSVGSISDKSSAMTRILRLAAGDVVTLRAFHSNASTQTLLASHTRFDALRIA